MVIFKLNTARLAASKSSSLHSVRTVFVIRYGMNLLERLFGSKQTKVNCELSADLRASAENGDAQSQNDLGKAFFLGTFGLTKDEAEAVKWYRKAAEQNHAEAQYNLGWRYADGRGVPKDEAEAVKWFRRAAEQDHADAQAHLGRCYYNGIGVKKDLFEAYKWESLARVKGRSGLSMPIVDQLEKQLPMEQVAEVQRLCRVFKPRHGSDSRGISWEGGNDRRKPIS